MEVSLRWSFVSFVNDLGIKSYLNFSGGKDSGGRLLKNLFEALSSILGKG